MGSKVMWAAPLLVICLASATVPRKPRDEMAEVIRATAQKHRASYVDISIVMSVTVEGSAHNDEVEVPGVIMDASGLIVTTSFAIDNESAGSRSQIVSIRIRPVGGGEVPGKVVLRDPDRGIAYLRPTQPLANVSALDFSQSVPVQMGDSVFTLGTLGRPGNRRQRVTVERIVGTIDKPRVTYVLSPSITVPLGNAVFNEKGDVVGLVTLKLSKSTGERSSFNAYDGGLVAIVDGKDIAETAQQAPQIKDLKSSTPTKKS